MDHAETKREIITAMTARGFTNITFHEEGGIHLIKAVRDGKDYEYGVRGDIETFLGMALRVASQSRLSPRQIADLTG